MEQIIGMLTVLYEPKDEYFRNIKKFYRDLNCLIIIDNSENNHKTKIIEEFGEDKGVEYYYLGENVGLCKAINMGIKVLSERGYNWCFYVDQDSVYINDLIQIYKDNVLFKSNNVGVIGPQHKIDRKHLKMKKGVKSKEWLMTSGCLFNIDTFTKIGGFDERIFLDGLDVEYCLRCRKNGHKVVQCLDAIIEHHPAVTKTKKIGFFTIKYGWDKPIRYYYKIRADVFMKKHYKTNYCKVDMIIKLAKIILFFDDKKIYFKAYQKGIHDAKNGIFGKYEDDRAFDYFIMDK